METIKRYGNYIIIICVILEMLIWPSINNFYGCLMTVIVWIIFSKIGLNEQVIREHIFAWLVFLSMSLYRILPIIATMLEGHSIGYNFTLPLSTYCGETILYLISALAFYLAIKCKHPLSSLKRVLYNCGFYDRVDAKILWLLGFIGSGLKIYVTLNSIEYGDVIGRTMVGFTFLQLAPILLFFPSLFNEKQKYKVFVLNKYCILYSILLVILSFATNKREAMLEPIGTFALLFFLAYINKPGEFQHIFNTKYIILGLLLAFLLLPVANDISLAMLYNRKYNKKEVNKTELFHKTMETFRNKDLMEELNSLKEESTNKEEIASLKNTKTWTETYVNNFALNRYCNLKVTDNTLYHAKKIGFADKRMFDDFWVEIAALLPTQIIKFLGIEYNKKIRYSRGDKLKALATNRHPFTSYLVTSHLADGLLTFGYWYFPIECLLFFLRFLFLDTFILRYKGCVYYSIFGLITIFSFLAMFRHADGCCDSLPYMLRGYWQDVILFTVGFTLMKRISLKL